MIDLPKSPKVDDLAAALVELDARLEALEVWRDAHEISKQARQRQVDAALGELRRMRRASPT